MSMTEHDPNTAALLLGGLTHMCEFVHEARVHSFLPTLIPLPRSASHPGEPHRSLRWGMRRRYTAVEGSARPEQMDDGNGNETNAELFRRFSARFPVHEWHWVRPRSCSTTDSNRSAHHQLSMLHVTSCRACCERGQECECTAVLDDVAPYTCPCVSGTCIAQHRGEFVPYSPEVASVSQYDCTPHLHLLLCPVDPHSPALSFSLLCAPCAFSGRMLMRAQRRSARMGTSESYGGAQCARHRCWCTSAVWGNFMV